MGRVGIYGTGGFGREILPLMRRYIAHRDGAAELVFVDDAATSQGVLGIPVIPFDGLKEGDAYVLAIGSGEIRRKLDERCRDAGLTPVSLFAESYRAGDAIAIGDGAVFCDNTMVTTSATIGRQFQCNIYSYVAHDCVIGDYVTFAPKVACNGNVHVEDFAYIGTGAVLRQGTPEKPLRIGRGAVVGMGAVVTKDVPAGETVVGNPAAKLNRA